MSHILKFEEWHDTITDTWHCNDVHSWKSGGWWLAPRMLRMELDDYVFMLANEYNAKISYGKDKCILLCSWKNQEDCRKFKNFINRKARETQFYVED